MLKQTPFHPHHLALGGKMVDFAGWDMPVQYTSITNEHLTVRSAVGLFDISHMGQIFVWGPEAEAYLQWMLSNDVGKAKLGLGLYTHFLNENGGTIDDLFVYRLEPEKFLLLINASRTDADLAWMNQHKSKFAVTILEAPMAAGLALQGPKAIDLMRHLSPDAAQLPRRGIGEFYFGGASALVARTGYTGEDGFEIFGPAAHGLVIWELLFKAGPAFGLVPCGLGARDTLRTEMGYPLYGHELDENHSPLEAGLGWAIALDKGDFIGRAALVKQKSTGYPVRLTGFKIESGGVARPSAEIFIAEEKVGTVASGTFSPSLGYPIGLAFLPANLKPEGSALRIRQGAREFQAVTTAVPFYSKKFVSLAASKPHQGGNSH